jgi:hypothetical protein
MDRYTQSYISQVVWFPDEDLNIKNIFRENKQSGQTCWADETVRTIEPSRLRSSKSRPGTLVTLGLQKQMMKF